jgi:hypothetical protein
MLGKCGEQQKIIYMVIAAKSAPPQKNGIDRARAVNNHGEQEKMAVGKPVHGERLKEIASSSNRKSGSHFHR